VEAPLDGRVAWCTGAETPLGRGLAVALARAGAAVALAGDAKQLASVVAELEAGGTRAIAVDTDFGARDSIDVAFAEAQDELGDVRIVVHAWLPARAFERVAFESVDDDRWEEVWEGAMRAALHVCQAAYPRLQGGGRLLFVTPTVSMSGAAELVPYTTAVEGVRLLAKSAARQWGPEGITVNCLAPAPEHAPIGVDSIAVSLAPPALGGPGDAERDLGPLAVFLASAAGHFVTGLTLSADGGVWMAP
jgi:NAD(P)-dependent dehydrogenase (short-subunit alcohol dehydrogenase family)